ncbi:MAG TPA: DivIVA domain-containing protein [Firmicutes bacterium]|jgi:cell division initiation protein|nr:DivIVA domain-containing protein [Bacillota bacterium]HHT42530.1 DivIVA domain-containing protein [Bacillota bacterium]
MLKPIDIHNMEFKRVFKGYDPEEVDDFLADIVLKYEAVYQENRKLRQELEDLRKAAGDKGSREQDVLDLISLTKQTVQEIKTMANREADNVISVAQAEAERIITESRLKAQQIIGDAEERLQKTERLERQMRERIRLTMETIWNSLNDEYSVTPEATRPYRELTSMSDTDEKTS